MNGYYYCVREFANNNSPFHLIFINQSLAKGFYFSSSHFIYGKKAEQEGGKEEN